MVSSSSTTATSFPATFTPDTLTRRRGWRAALVPPQSATAFPHKGHPHASPASSNADQRRCDGADISGSTDCDDGGVDGGTPDPADDDPRTGVGARGPTFGGHRGGQ